MSLLEAGVLFTDFRFSLTRSVVGFVLGGIAGVLAGLLTGRLKPVEFILSPMILLFRPIPAIALVPVATVWFGIGERAKYFVIAYSVFLAVWLNVHAGASSVSETHLRVARSLGASRTRTFREVVVPAAAPDIVNGLRYGSAVAFIVLIAAELAGARAGMGYRIQISAEFLQTDRIFFGLVQLGVLGAILDALFVFTSRRIIHWGER
ncbi:MAG: ABC transporter permease [Acidimicrobiaceae bacterium]|nr:ABC transporter permease [Acidimicrobiaceae bacterium]